MGLRVRGGAPFGHASLRDPGIGKRGACGEFRWTEDFRVDLDGAARGDRGRPGRPGTSLSAWIGTAGTVNTGAIDDLESLAEICRHGGALVSRRRRLRRARRAERKPPPAVAGLERADSIAFDFHKWMHVQYDAGGLLVRDGEKHRAAFSVRHRVSALARTAGSPVEASGRRDLGPELSRGFRALKVWIALKEYGAAAFARSIERTAARPEFLADLIRKIPASSCCARRRSTSSASVSVPPGWESPPLDRLNEDVVVALQESGVAVPSATRIRDHLAIRVNLTNHRTRQEDLDLFVRSAAEEAARRIPAR